MRLKVLVVSELWWPEGGGGVLATYFITKLLSEHADVTVVTGSRRVEPIRGVRFVFEPLLSVRAKPLLWVNLLRLAGRSYFIKLVRDADVVYIPRLAYPLIPIVKGFGRRVVVHVHDHQPISYSSVVFSDREVRGVFDDVATSVRLELLENRSLFRALVGGLLTPVNSLVRLWLRDVDAIICPSNYLANVIGGRFPELRGRLRVVYNPVLDAPPTVSKEDSRAFLYVGGDSYIKGFHVLMDAVARALGKGLEFRLFIAGSVRGKLGGNGFVSFLGRLSHSDVLRLHGGVRALVFPSIVHEPLPTAVVESMLVGTLPIASRVGGVPEILRGTPAEGLMFSPGDVDGLVDRMEQVLSMSREEVVDAGLKLRRHALRLFDVDEVRARLMKVFIG